jgi:hypothetical protein
MFFTKEKQSLIETIFFLVFIKKVSVAKVGVCYYSMHDIEHLGRACKLLPFILVLSG